MKTKPTPYFLLLPALTMFTLAILVPAVEVVRLSFYETNLMSSEFVGLRNFAAIATDRRWLKAFVNSFVYVGMIVPVQIAGGLSIALLAAGLRKWAQDYIRFVVYIPIFSAGIIIASAWKWLWNYRYGLVNWVIAGFGVRPIMWLGHRFPAMFVISIAMVTTTVGFYVVMFLAAILAIPKELYAAAQIDGASAAQIRRRIVIPIISPTIAMLSMFCMIATMQIWETIYLMTAGGPIGGSANLMYDVYTTGIVGSRYGVASAKTVVLILIVLTMAKLKRRAENHVAGS